MLQTLVTAFILKVSNSSSETSTICNSGHTWSFSEQSYVALVHVLTFDDFLMVKEYCKVQLNRWWACRGYILSYCLFMQACVFFYFLEYVALYTYESPEPGDLTFREGDVILVSKKEGEWWNGSTGGSTGLFPSNYVKPKEPDVRALNMYRHTVIFLSGLWCRASKGL